MMKKQIFYSALVVLGAFYVCSPVWAQGFFETLPDVPLMEGLIELEDQAVGFDKPEGRILSGEALIPPDVSDSELERYYMQTLPQFGWQSQGDSKFVRGDENLRFKIEGTGAEKILEITIIPLRL